ncbi:condensin complex subunit 1 [Pocillopora verrucosa]|uniref:condensin complex subunit 1 n=1 Tax=Pocillopora verrucosa TaxID=203993 RepID=UPI00334007AC
MDEDFVIPLCKDDLLSSEEGSYVVDEVLSVRVLPNKLRECLSDLRSGVPTAIVQNFDCLFSLLRHFNEVDSSLRESTWNILLEVLCQFTNVLPEILEDGDIDFQVRRTHLNTLKMLCYLIVQLADAFEVEATKPSTEVIVSGKRKGKATNSKKKTSSSWEWEEQRDVLIQTLGQLMQLDVNRLWDPPIIEEEFVNLVTGCCYKFLENPTSVKNGTTKDLIFNLLGVMVKKYNYGLGISLKIVQLLQHFEHLVQPLAQAVQTFVDEFSIKGVVSEVIREIGRMDPRDLSRDTSGTRAYADFLVELAGRVPSQIIPNISVLLCHLDGESYSMRNGILALMGEIVIKVLSKEDLDDAAKKLRDQLLDKMEDHIHDVNAYVRSKALHIWLELCKKEAIPLSRQPHLLELVINRLQDKSSIVRKNAIQLLKTFLICNPFGAQLPLDHLRQNLSKETEKLKEMAPQLCEENDGQVEDVKKIWEAIKPEVQATIEECLDLEEIIDEGDGAVEFQGDQESALECALKQIRGHLHKGHHKKALAVLKAAMVTWPEYTMFFRAERDPEQQEDEESNKSADENLVNKRSAEEQLSIMQAVFLAGDNEEPTPHVEGKDIDPTELLEVSAEHENRNTSAEEPNNGLVNEITKQQMVVQFLKDYVHFQTQMERAIPTLCQLLGSKSITDVNESIEFFVVASEFGLQSAIIGVRRMLVLIWSRDTAVRDAVVEAYKGLYLDPVAPNARTKTALIVKNLITLTQGASMGDLTSLEELMSELMKGKLIPVAVIKLLWEKFTMKDPQTTQEESRMALVLLGMLAGAEMDIVRTNIDVLVSTGLGPRAEEDFLLARDTCVALLKLGQTHKKPGCSATEPFRLPPKHTIFERLTEILVSGVCKLDQLVWTPLMEKAITVIYVLAEHPETIAENVIKKIAACLLDKTTQDKEEPRNNQNDSVESNPDTDRHAGNSATTCQAGILARFFSLSGHVALRHMVHLDVGVLGEIKRRQVIEENDKEKEKQAKKTRGAGSECTANSTKDPGASETIEEELGLTGATADDVETEYVRKICEHEIVTGGTLLATLRPLLVHVCSNPVKFSDTNLRAAASLALAKFMLVSSEFCEEHLQLLFTILEKAPQATIRANTIVAVGDLTFRFPNLIEPWTPHLYARLRDESSHVRKNTLMVLTHLILNDMVKVKGQISEMATCLEDKDGRISDLAKLFFLELSKKGNAIYNILPDVISRLSDPDCGTEEEPFRNIMRYLLSFIQKDRQSESLVEKLCHRFRATKTDRQWRDLAFCLSMLSYNERGIRKLQENFSCFHDKLAEEDVYHSFLNIVGKSKKFAKPEVKALVDELEQRINFCHTKGMEDEEDYERASKAVGAATGNKPKKSAATPAAKTSRGPKGRTPGTKKRQPKTVDDSDAEDPSPMPFKTPRSVARPPKAGKEKSTNQKRRKMPSFESDEDDSIELFDVGEEEEDCQRGIDWNDEENVNPNVTSKNKANDAISKKGRINSQRKSNRRRVSST